MDIVNQVPPVAVERAPGSWVAKVTRPIRGAVALRRWAVASLAMNIVIVLTGGLVRLTGSGLGCPTWPKCTDQSYVAHPALGVHGAIEFGNRLLAFVLVIVAILTWASAFLARTDGRYRRDLRWLTGAMLLGVPLQAVIGGISVLTQLNPFVVALHLLASMVLIALSVWLVRKTRSTRPTATTSGAVWLARTTFVLMWAAVWLGTVVTGSGPHAGDEHAVRTGFDGLLVARLHAGTVYATIAATLGCVVLLRSRAALLVLGVEVLQAAVGLTQYHLGLPIGLVILHLLGASLAIASVTNLMLSVRNDRITGVSGPGPARQAADHDDMTLRQAQGT
jgi:cytochrome c oxidase assembly protein subunit 15